MKQIMLCAQALALGLCFTPVNAASHWYWIYPKVQGRTLNAIDVMSPTSAMAVGELGAVVHTVDLGATWYVRPMIPGLPDLNGVSIITPTTIVVVGNGGLILRSVNGAGTWHAEVSGTTADLLDVDFHGSLSGFAVGSNGTILRSDDAGVTWVPQSGGTSVTLHGVRMVDGATATVVGSGGTILKTADAGANWVPQTSGTTADLLDVDFYGTNVGIAVGYGTTVLMTTDGGTTWSPPASPIPATYPITARAVDMARYPHVVVVGSWDDVDDTAALMSTTDGGVSWSVSYHMSTAQLYGVAMFSNSEAVAIGAGGTIRRTTDGGVSWPQIAGGLPRFAMDGVDFFDALHGVAVARDIHGMAPSGYSRVYATTDGGQTWSAGQPFPYYLVPDVSFADANTIYLVGRGPYWMDVGGTIWRSTNGGPWTEIYTACCTPDCSTCIPHLSAVDFAGPDVGVAVGWGEGVVTILGGVATWVALPMLAYLNGVSVPTPETAYAVGDAGVIIKGDLVAGSWVTLTSGTTETLSDVFFIDELTGWIVGESGTILFTSDGGDSWMRQASGTTSALTSVSFIDATNGLIGSAGAMILKTADGGTTWQPEDTFFPIADVDFVDPVCAVAAGGMENIIMHRDAPVPVFFQDVSASARPYAVELRWVVHADEAIRGFRVYRRVEGAGEVAITSELLAPAGRSFVDRDVVPGRTYEYSVVALDEGGATIRSQPVGVNVPDASVTLLQNNPNPFNPSTRIRYTLPVRAHVTLSVYDVAGRRIATLIDGVRPGGEHAVTWDGRDGAGNPSPSGVYFYELRTRDAVFSRKMVLVK